VRNDNLVPGFFSLGMNSPPLSHALFVPDSMHANRILFGGDFRGSFAALSIALSIPIEFIVIIFGTLLK
jgi:hypothetical protein